VEPEDVDPALRGRGDESAHEISADRSRTDEESPSQRHRKRRLRARLERPDPLPWALDATVDGAVEDTASRDLEVREAGAVQSLGQPEQVRRRHPARQRLLGQQPDRRIDKRGHVDPGA